jgi:hypothetical protein
LEWEELLGPLDAGLFSTYAAEEEEKEKVNGNHETATRKNIHIYFEL